MVGEPPLPGVIWCIDLWRYARCDRCVRLHLLRMRSSGHHRLAL